MTGLKAEHLEAPDAFGCFRQGLMLYHHLPRAAR